MATKVVRKTTSAKAKTNGAASTKKRDTASTAKAAKAQEPAKKKGKEPTANELMYELWQHIYETRDKRIIW